MRSNSFNSIENDYCDDAPRRITRVVRESARGHARVSRDGMSEWLGTDTASLRMRKSP